jgi:NAD(P)-dependent dehydrogenase (short-subunit alcohol dehydrogenase family)
VTPDIAVVTGANRGIGLEVARQLAGLGYEVVLTARDPDQAAAAAAAIDGAVPHRLDVTSPTDAVALADFLADRYGKLDVLVNNAAITYDTWQRASTANLDIVREAAETNLYGPWRLVITLLDLLRASPHARIVNVSSEAASLASLAAGAPAYVTTKVALNALTKILAAELHPDNILVNAVCPGWTATDMGGPAGRPIPEGAASIVWAATLPPTAPTGAFYRDTHPIPW